MKKIFLAAVVAVLFSATAARADFYLSAGVGLNINDSDLKTFTDSDELKSRYDNSPTYSLALGYDIPVIPVRVEIEGFRTQSDVNAPVKWGNSWLMKNETMTVNAAMANAYVRIPVFGLYAGVGAGYGKVEDEKTPLYQGMIGLEYGLPVVPLHVGIEYRHIQAVNDFDEIKAFDSIRDFTRSSSKFRADVLMAKIRFDF